MKRILLLLLLLLLLSPSSSRGQSAAVPYNPNTGVVLKNITFGPANPATIQAGGLSGDGAKIISANGTEIAIGGNLTLEDGTLSAAGGGASWPGDASQLTAADGTVVSVGGNLILDAGTLSANVSGNYVPLTPVPNTIYSSPPVFQTPINFDALTGSTATSLDTVATVDIPSGGSTIIALLVQGKHYFYALINSTEAESSPWYVRPDDFDQFDNPKVWKLIGGDGLYTGNLVTSNISLTGNGSQVLAMNGTARTLGQILGGNASQVVTGAGGLTVLGNFSTANFSGNASEIVTGNGSQRTLGQILGGNTSQVVLGDGSLGTRGIGGGTGATDNAVLRADGTGNATLKTSTIIISDLSNSTQNTTMISVDDGVTANISIAVNPKGTGAFILGPLPDGTAAGGNARGQYAVDLQRVHTATQVASGIGSFISGGANNTASGQYASSLSGTLNIASGLGAGAGGFNSTASGSYAFAWGLLNNASNYASFCIGQEAVGTNQYQFSQSSGAWGGPAGEAQFVRQVVRNKTTNGTAQNLYINGTGASQRFTISTNRTIGFMVRVVGTQNSNNSTAMYQRKGIIRNRSGTTTLVTSETIGTDYEDEAAWDIALSADDTNDALQIAVTGNSSNTVRWVGTIEGVEVGFGN